MFEIKDGKFYHNGEKVNIYSGVIHYFRVLPEYWRDRLLKLKLAGFNTVETYVSWNLHEPKPGEFDFSGMLDIRRFIETAKELGLYAIVRPGPYICAEWDNGGLPAWLLKDKNMRIRCAYEPYLELVKRYYGALMKEIGDLQETRVGNIIAMQVENEYGSYGNDKEYLLSVEKIMKDTGMDVLFFTSDGDWKNMLSGGSLPHIYKVLNFGSRASSAFNALKGFQENMPHMCGEFWDGWFDHWGEKHHTRDAASIVKELKDFLAADANFNFYMFIGGTNFNFWAGSNYHNGKFHPTTTSYDYSALLTEWGDITEQYKAVREVLLKHRGIEYKEEIPTVKYLGDSIKLDMSKKGSLRRNMGVVATKHRSAAPESMEYYGQNFGYIVYHTDIKGKYDTLINPLVIKDIHDRAYVYINGELKGTFYRNKKKGLLSIFKMNKDNEFTVRVPSIDGSLSVDILVDAMGRVDYGYEKMYDRKGIGDVRLGNQLIFGWDAYTIPLDDVSNVIYDGANDNEPMFLKAEFDVKDKGEAFIHMDNFKKGVVFVNGFNIGRYWEIGPQKALYIPASLLKVGEKNEIVIFETEGFKSPSVVIDGKPDLG